MVLELERSRSRGHVLAITNSAAVNIGTLVRFCIIVFSRYIGVSEVAGSYGTSIYFWGTPMLFYMVSGLHMYNGLLLSHKKEWDNAIGSNLDGPRHDHTKWRCDITYMWNLKYDTNEFYLQNRNWLTDTENRPVVAVGEGRIGSLGFTDANYYI